MPCLRRQLAQPLEEARLRQDGADVVRDRLEDDRGDVVVGERALDRVRVVERADDRRVQHLRQDPLRERVLAADALGGRDHVHRDRVVPAVVAALELEHVAPAGDRAREPERVEGRLAPGRRQQHLLERGHDVDEPLGELDLDRRHADAHQPGRARGGRVDVGVVVPEERRAEGGVVVGVDPALRVGEGRAARRGDDEVLEPGDAALAAVHAAGDHGGRTRGERGGGFG